MTNLVEITLFRVAYYILVALALIPFVYSTIVFAGSQIQTIYFGDFGRAVPAFINSLCIAMLVSTITLAFACTIILIESRIREALAFSVIGLLVPGEFIAQGGDRFIALITNHGGSHILESALFIASLTEYAFPFTATAILLIRYSLSAAELLALDELSPSSIHKGLRILNAYKPQLLVAWIVGLNIVLAEAARTRILHQDIFGLGSQYFGPLLVDAFGSRGLEQIYFFLTYASSVLIALLMVMSVKQSRVISAQL